jgi:hypothetical protein
MAGTLSWEKYNVQVAEKCGVLLMGNTLINKKQDFAIFTPSFYLIVWGNLQMFWWWSKNLY